MPDIDTLTLKLLEDFATRLNTFRAEIKAASADDQLQSDIMDVLKKHGINATGIEIQETINIPPPLQGDEGGTTKEPKAKRTRKPRKKKEEVVDPFAVGGVAPASTAVVHDEIVVDASTTKADVLACCRAVSEQFGKEGIDAMSAAVQPLGFSKMVDITDADAPNVMVALKEVEIQLSTKYPKNNG